MHHAFIITPLLVALAAPSLAFELERCNRSLDGIHVGNTSYSDHGGGLISYESSSFTGDNDSSFLVITECTTGKEIIVQISNTDYVAPNGITRVKFLTKFNRRSRIEATFAKILESNEEHSVDELALQLKRTARGHLRVEMSDEENCGCASRYPELRGSLKKFELREWD